MALSVIHQRAKIKKKEKSPDTFFDASDKPEGNENIPTQQSQVRSTQAMETSQFIGQELTDNSNHTTYQ